MNGRVLQARWTVAWALALVLALQSVFTGLALGSTEGPLQRDALGNVICASAAGTDQDGGGPREHHSLPDCCTFACSMFWSQLPAPDGSSVLATIAAPRTATRPALVLSVASSFLDHRRGYPRAPPMMA